MLNIISKAKYSISLKNFQRVTALIKAFDVDCKKKAATFSKEDFDKFVGAGSISTPYWLLRKVCFRYIFITIVRLI